MLYDILQYAVDGLRRRKLRSWLTITGIVIAVMALVLLVSLGQGIEVAIKSQLAVFGNDMISIAPGSSSSNIFSALVPSGTLTEKDVAEVRRIGDVELVSYALQEQANVQFKDESAAIFMMGTTSDILVIMPSFQIEQGRSVLKGERGVAVIGHKLANDFWGTSKKREVMRLGSRVLIENHSFSVIGILKEQGGISSASDSVIYIPVEDARDVLPTFIGNDQITEMYVKVREGVKVSDVSDEIKRKLDNLHKVKSAEERDYQVITSDQIMEYVGAITGFLTLFLGGAAAISLLVGSVGIANTMFMSVMERTREIGILKATGATDSMIRNIFLVESGLIGAVGGIIGVILSYIIDGILAFIASLAGVPMPLDITWQLVAGAIAFSFSVGLVSGYFPARRAAGLLAVEALRYE